MRTRRLLSRLVPVLLLPLVALTLTQAPASAATITVTRDAQTVAASLADPLGSALTGSSFPVLPPATQTECTNGIDDDGDGLVDFTPPAGGTKDPGCTTAGDNRELEDAPACANGLDDDFDGATDFVPPAGETKDPGCTGASDNNEVDFEPDPTPQCSNGADDDFDGLVDFSALSGEQPDPGCTSAGDIDEGSDGFPVDRVDPVAVVSSPLAGFPTSGSSFAILTSGDALLADDENVGGSSGAGNGGGGGGHGDSFHDLVTLRLDVTVPAGANCLALDFRFLSEEFPEFVGGSVNDGFVAELDTSDFTADAGNNNAVVAPHNFAFDDTGSVISINTAGFSADAAAGTTYDGATSKLRALTPVTPGNHVVFLSVFDQGDSAYDSAALIDNLRTFTVPTGSCQSGATDDLTPPDTSITAGPSGATNDSTPTFTFTSSEAGSTFQCRIDGGAWEPCTTPHTTAELAAGTHTFEVRAIDSSGNVDPTPASREFTVETVQDTTPPDTTITAGPTGVTNDSTPTFTFTATEAGSTFQCRVDDGAWEPCTTPHTTGTLADGTHKFEVRAVDAAGNVDPTPASRTFTVDTTPPDTTITAGPSGTTNDSTPTFSFTATEAGSTFACRVDGGAWGSCTTPHTTGTLADGTHTFEVQATDGAGNTDPTPASRTFTVDATPPPPPPPPLPPAPAPTCDSLKATIVGTAGDDEITGTAGNDVIVGLGGNDHIAGGGGHDVICGGDGNDKLDGAAGKDTLLGEAGKDKLVGGGGADLLDGGGAADRLIGNGGDDEMLGGGGDDQLAGAAGDDDLAGGAGDDRLEGDGGDDRLDGNGGDDLLDGGTGRDRGDGGGGTDVVVRCES